MKYILEYNGKKVTRHADTAEKAIEKLCDQYGWSYTLYQYDADTRGREWAECRVDTDGGINWNLRVLATREEPKEPDEPDDELSAWKIFESDIGSVFRAITRDEANDLCSRGYGSLVMVSKPDAPYLRRYTPTAAYTDEIFWKQILSPVERRNVDWKADYRRIHAGE